MSIDINNHEEKVYIVLGAPRSATSFLSKALQKCGINMTLPKWSDKPFFKKFYEDESFVKLNQKILRSVPGGGWDNPPSKKQMVESGFGRRARKLIEERKGKLKFWGLKDPRMALTFDVYKPYLDGDVYLVCCFRKPQKVLESFKRKKNKNINKKTLDKYNKSIIKIIEDFVDL